MRDDEYVQLTRVHDWVGVVVRFWEEKTLKGDEFIAWMRENDIAIWRTIPYAYIDADSRPVALDEPERGCITQCLTFLTDHMGGVKIALRWADHLRIQDVEDCRERRLITLRDGMITLNDGHAAKYL